MRKLNFILLAFVLIAVSFASYSQDGASTITVTEMGTLGTLLDQKQKNTITGMIIKGEINAADFEVMKNHMPNLTYIDLKDVKCENDQMSKFAFGDPTATLSNTNISTIILPLSIKTIEVGAFRYCTGLTGDLTIPEGVTKIGNGAYRYCIGLKGSLSLPSSLITIEGNVFRNNHFAGSVVFPEKLESIGENAFFKCPLISELEFGSNLKTIDNGAFLGCSRISGDVVIPSSVEAIGEKAFNLCPKISAFVFPHDKVFPYAADMLTIGATIKVPANLVDNYKANADWKDHKGNIKAI